MTQDLDASRRRALAQISAASLAALSPSQGAIVGWHAPSATLIGALPAR